MGAWILHCPLRVAGCCRFAAQVFRTSHTKAIAPSVASFASGFTSKSVHSPARRSSGRRGFMPTDPWFYLLLSFLGLLLGLALGYAGCRSVDRMRIQSAQSRVEEIGANARKEAENIVKEAELKAKD